MQVLARKRQAAGPCMQAHPLGLVEHQMPALPAKPGQLAVSFALRCPSGKPHCEFGLQRHMCMSIQVSHLNLPQFIPNSPSVEDVSYRKDASLRVTPLDLARLQRGDAPAFVSSNAAAAASLPVAPGNSPVPDAATASSRAVPDRPIRTQMQPVKSGTTDQRVVKLAQQSQHAASDLTGAQSKWPSALGISSPQQTIRLAMQPSGRLLASTAGTARTAISTNSNNAAAKSWQQVLATASAHEQWVMQRHLAHGRMSETGNEGEWGELLVRVPKQASIHTEEVLQHLPEGLAGSIHIQTASQVWLHCSDTSCLVQKR